MQIFESNMQTSRNFSLTNRTPNFEHYYNNCYLKYHNTTGNKLVHWMGVNFLIMLIAAAIMTSNPYLLINIPMVSFAYSFVGHYLVEENVMSIQSEHYKTSLVYNNLSFPQQYTFGIISDFRLWYELSFGIRKI